MTVKPFAIGIDLGGTRIKLACVREDGNVLERRERGTGDDGAAASAELIRRELAGLADHVGGEPEWVGVAAPGLAAGDGRSIAFMPGRLEGLEGLDWTRALEARRPVPVLNDAHAHLLGEAWLGAARGLRDVVLLTLGTGVGGAVLTEGRLLRGHIGRAGHLGHISLDPDGPLDIVNTPGSLEAAIGECTIEARTGGRFASTRELVDASRAGDVEATAVWLRSVRALACALASIVNAVDPEAVVLGGGIARAGPALFEPLEEQLARVEWRPGGHRVRILAAALGEHAGALGAAYNAIHHSIHDAERTET